MASHAKLMAAIDPQKVLETLDKVQLPPELVEQLEADSAVHAEKIRKRAESGKKLREYARRVIENGGTEEDLERLHLPKKGVIVSSRRLGSNGSTKQREEAVAAAGLGDPDSHPEVVDPDPHAAEIHRMAESTPEVRWRPKGAYSDDEIKIIAAALMSRMPLYKVAASLKCTLVRVMNAVNSIPSLKSIAEDQKIQEKMMAQEAVDDCLKARVPAVVMWHAQHVLPEKYGDQVNIDNEDDTRIVIGAIDEDMVAEAEAEVAAASNTVPDGGGVAILDAMDQERAAEDAAAGGDVSVVPLAQTPPAPAVAPPGGDPRFMEFSPASQMARMEGGMDDYGPFGDDEGFGDDGFGGGGDPW